MSAQWRPAIGIAVAAVLTMLLLAGCSSEAAPALEKTAQATNADPPPDPAPAAAYVSHPKGSLTFTRHIAPIVFQKCLSCHRAGEIGPFPLASYRDVQKRAKQIVQITQNRLMPPWPPAPGYCDFEQDRSLSVEEIGLIAQWTQDGCVEGSASDLPAVPEFPSGWKYGKPDLVVTMEAPLELPAEGKDIYRKFVLRVPLKERRYVRAYDFDPGNRKVVHHAMIRIDSTGWSRFADERDPLPGFNGTMMAGDETPDGFVLGWSPGYAPPPSKNSFAWPLEPGTDLVLELHMNPTGKPESIRSSIALYFAPEPPKEHPCVVQLQYGQIDIPAGKSDYVVEDAYDLPVDARAVSIYPHAHYLCKDMQVYAQFPNGTKSWLLRIKDWDFNWQNSYVYAAPIQLPAGTQLRMRFQYDNSAGNPRNPRNPPRPVHYGRTSENEMGLVTIQLLAGNDGERQVLRRDFALRELQNTITVNQHRLKWESEAAEAHYNLGTLYDMLGDFQKAASHYEQSLSRKPDDAWAHNNLGTMYLNLRRLDDAAAEYNASLRLDSKSARSHNNLGLVYLQQGKLDAGVIQFEEALRMKPEFPEAETNLGKVFLQRRDLHQAAIHFERALKFNSNYEEARVNLARIQASLTRNR